MALKKEDIYFWPMVKIIPSKLFLKLHFRISCKRKLDLKNPKGFNEKLQWLKLNDRNPRYTDLVDKIEAKKIVGDLIGQQYIIPTLGTWDRFDDIDWDQLPNQFVLKTNHDSGGLYICRNKADLDIEKARRIINKSLKRNFFYLGREWPYKNVRPRILAEKYMSEQDFADGEEGKTTLELGLTDYKFYCFNGEPKFLYISKGLEDHSTALMTFLDMDWKLTPYQRSDFPGFTEVPEKPAHFDEMAKLSSVLAKDIPFVRVDFYEIRGQVYFSEMTFSPSSGFAQFSPIEWENRIGDWIRL